MTSKLKLKLRQIYLSPALPAMAFMAVLLFIAALSVPQAVFAEVTEADAQQWAKEGLGLILTVIQVFCIIAGVVLAMVGIYYMAVGKAMEEGPKMNKGIGMVAGAVALFVVPAVIKQISWSNYLTGLTDVGNI